MDSNHRRLRQLSYSQPHLATLVTALVLKNSLLFCGYKYRTFSIRCKILNTKVRIKSDKQKNVAKLLADRRFRKTA